MKNKKYIFSFLIILLAFFSCTEDGDVFDLPEDRDAFIGTWNVNETCIRDAYSVSIVADPANSSQVIIKNFWLIGYNEKPPYAIVAGSTITIPTQTICYSGSNTVSGSGKLNKNKIEWEYTVNDGADLWTCTSTYEKP